MAFQLATRINEVARMTENRLHIYKRPCCSHLLRGLALRTQIRTALAIHQVSEILPVKGVELAGLLPPSIQNYTAYAGAVSTSTTARQAARSFLDALAAPDAAATIQAKGMLPAQAAKTPVQAQQ